MISKNENIWTKYKMLSMEAIVIYVDRGSS